MALTVSELMTHKILYFDPDFAEECVAYALNHQISEMPIVDDLTKCVVFEPNYKVYYQEITSEHKVTATEFAFSNTVLEKLIKNHVLFVYSNDNLCGVLHFSDYNKKPVYKYIFNQIFDIEGLLRKFLASFGYTHRSMLDFFKEKSKKNGKSYYINRYLELEPTLKEDLDGSTFEKFYLVELIDLVNHSKVLKLSRSIGDIRNATVHVRDFIGSTATQDLSHFFRSKEEFASLFNEVSSILLLKRKLRNILRLKQDEVLR